MSVWLLLAAVVGIVGVPMPAPSDDQLAQFARLEREIGERLYVVDAGGHELVGRLAESNAQGLTLDFGQGSREHFPADQVIRVDRDGDSVIDGVVKGGLIGLLLASVFSQNFSSGAGPFVVRSVAVYASLGYLFDLGRDGRVPVYRAPGAVTLNVATLRW